MSIIRFPLGWHAVPERDGHYEMRAPSIPQTPVFVFTRKDGARGVNFIGGAISLEDAAKLGCEFRFADVKR